MKAEVRASELSVVAGADSGGGAARAASSVDPAVLRYFDSTTAYWDGIYSGSRFINWHMDRRRQLTVTAAERVSKGRVLSILDLGCGSGVLTRDLARLGHSVAAIDCSSNMIRHLRESICGQPERRRIRTAIGSANETCFAAATFDLVVCIGVIQYQRRPEALLGEIQRVLRPGGTCIFTVPNQLSLHHLLDPWCHLRWLGRMAARRIGKGESWLRSCKGAIDRSAYTADAFERRYFRSELDVLLGNGFTMQQTTGFGYGPITIANRRVFPDRISIALSRGLERLSAWRPFRWLTALANRWVVVAGKKCSE